MKYILLILFWISGSFADMSMTDPSSSSPTTVDETSTDTTDATSSTTPETTDASSSTTPETTDASTSPSSSDISSSTTMMSTIYPDTNDTTTYSPIESTTKNGTHVYKDDPYWTEVIVTWCSEEQLATNNSSCFKSVPSTAYEALDLGWELISHGPDGCENYGRFNGYRYVYDEDWSLVLLYDRYGYISGIQTHMLAEELTSCNNSFYYAYNHVPYFLKTKYDGQDYYTLTAYFQNPRTICESGRSLPEYIKEGLGGYGIWFQYGSTPYVTDFCPSYRPAAVEKHWDNAQCVDAMGYHNFKNMHSWTHDNCYTIPPYSVLFDGDDYMRGFVFMAMGIATSTYDHYEYLPGPAFKYVVNGNPCVEPYYQYCGGITTMHVYFVKKPYTFKC